MDDFDYRASESEIRREEGWDFPDPATEQRYEDEYQAAQEAANSCKRCDKPFHECECFKVWADQVVVTSGRFEDR